MTELQQYVFSFNDLSKYQFFLSFHSKIVYNYCSARCMIVHVFCRLSYHQRIVDTVPDNFEPLIPAKPSAFYKYEKEDASSLPGTMVAHQLIASIKAKCTAEEALEVVKQLPNPLKDEEGMWTDSPFMI